MNKIKNRKLLLGMIGGHGVYKWLMKNNPTLLDKRLPNTRIKWNLEICKINALKYKTRKEWETQSVSAYTIAHKNGWLEECCAHMEKSKTAKRKVKNLDTGEIFESITAAGSGNAAGIRRAIKDNIKCGGYRWAYCDENGNIIE